MDNNQEKKNTFSQHLHVHVRTCSWHGIPPPTCSWLKTSHNTLVIGIACTGITYLYCIVYTYMYYTVSVLLYILYLMGLWYQKSMSPITISCNSTAQMPMVPTSSEEIYVYEHCMYFTSFVFFYVQTSSWSNSV